MFHYVSQPPYAAGPHSRYYHSPSNFFSYDAARSSAERRALAHQQLERRLQEEEALQRAQEEYAYRSALREREERARRVAEAELAMVAKAEAFRHERQRAQEYEARLHRQQQASHPANFFPHMFANEVQRDRAAFSIKAPSRHRVIYRYAPEQAAVILQRRVRAYLNRKHKIQQLNGLAAELASHTASFVLPASLEFQPAAASPKLAFSSHNSTVLAYEDYLVGLLSKLDAVESNGDEHVKNARKALVKAVEAELARLDKAKEDQWTKQGAAVQIAITEPVSDGPSTGMQVDEPAPSHLNESSAPLPLDDEMTSTPSPADPVTTAADAVVEGKKLADADVAAQHVSTNPLPEQSTSVNTGRIEVDVPTIPTSPPNSHESDSTARDPLQQDEEADSDEIEELLLNTLPDTSHYTAN